MGLHNIPFVPEKSCMTSAVFIKSVKSPTGIVLKIILSFYDRHCGGSGGYSYHGNTLYDTCT